MKKTAAIILAVFVSIKVGASDKNIYLDLMQKAVEAYSMEQVEDYIHSVETEGIKEHGYARLTSNIGILIAHGRLPEYRQTFEHMMDVCMKELPVAKINNKTKVGTGNDFAVKEIVCCILELEAAGTFRKEKTDQWRNALAVCKAGKIYDCQPRPGGKNANNWCVFGAASECARLMAGIGGEKEFAERYISDQVRFFDENGMFKDPHQPMLYDIVTRLQFMSALSFGYDGPTRDILEEHLLKSAFHTIELQSVTGEMPYGGRSNQFLHNDTALAAVFEFYASWMKRRGDLDAARRFKAAAMRAVRSLDFWLEQKPVTHIKNRYPTETGYGCENYAYFKKYMVTMGSWAYLAYRFADDTIEPATRKEPASTFVTSPDFHRILMNSGNYSLEFDINAEKPYDCNGLGRFQKRGSPCTIALASPCAGSKPNYRMDIVNEGPLSISPEWKKYEVVEAVPGKLVLTDGNQIWETSLSRRGLRMTLEGKGDLHMTIPAFLFDGETETRVDCTESSIVISYKGWRCRWKIHNGTFVNTGKVYGNRNGHLLRIDAVGKDGMTLTASICR